MTVRTRFAPSPTGYLHIGGARTALFSWLQARHCGGQFVLRIEDTDRERSTEPAVQAILDGMRWLGLDWDEGPFYQTQRFDRYREVIEQLLQSGHAYRCYCSREELDAMRSAQQARGEKSRYDGRCRERSEPRPGVEPVLRFRMPRTGTTAVEDRVRGRVNFANDELDDLIIARSDGSPTYNLTVVVDDMDMGITDVIRGDDHLNNTPKQINIFNALGAKVPAFAHLPMILGPDGAKLSKRHGAVGVMQYREEGFLPGALVNYLVRLGWAHGDQELFSRAEMIEMFDIADVNHSASAINTGKLEWLNQHYVKQADTESLAAELAWQLARLDIAASPDPGKLKLVVAAQRERVKTLAEMAENSRFFFRRPTDYEPKAARKNLKREAEPLLAAVRCELAGLQPWQAEAIHAAVVAVAERASVKLGKVAQPVRVAVCGGAVSPPIDATLAILGREETLARIDRARKWIASQVESA
ncbi:MAG: glutamate--tRNA ligase [Gammaproteobacteria bacterium]|nr:glutamate--tRNA ligase [Gammaproteobacteria bacterium]